jgi:PRTRC genetic system protein E
MTLFCELYAMARTCSLSMLVTADTGTGKLTVHVLPKPKPNSDAHADTGAEMALTQPLCLTATPEEFDQDFVAALRSYRECHHSLTEQVQATCDLLKAAKDASAKKAATAVSKAQRPAGKGVPAASSTAAASRHAASPHGADDDDQGHDGGDGRMVDSPDEAEGHAVEDATTESGPAAAPDAAQPQLFG